MRIDYSSVLYKLHGEEVYFDSEQLKRDLSICGYDEKHIFLILESLHSGNGAIHETIKE